MRRIIRTDQSTNKRTEIPSRFSGNPRSKAPDPSFSQKILFSFRQFSQERILPWGGGRCFNRDGRSRLQVVNDVSGQRQQE